MSDLDLLLPKLCGADVELGNFVLGDHGPMGSGPEASQALLREMPGLPRPAERPQPLACGCPACRAKRRGGGRSAGRGWLARRDRQEWGRRFLPANGGCAYIDLDHLELCLPEVRSAFDHVAAWRAMLRLAQGALARANAERPPEARLVALVNNSDGQGSSYGGHLNVLVGRRAWQHATGRKPHHLAFFAAHLASSLVLFGQGKVGSENGAPPVAFQTSQRADFLETLLGPQTTFRRPLVNTRDEPLAATAGGGGRPARMHVIVYDSTLCPVACLLKIGSLQLVLAMLETGRVDPRLALEDPLEAVALWSHDPDLERRAPLVDGTEVTAVELQRRFCDAAHRFAAAGEAEGVVPRAAEVLAWWGGTLDLLAARDWAALARRLDWVLKRGLLARLLARRPDLSWDSPEVRHLDQLYAGLDPGEGLFWSLERQGLVEPVVPEARIAELAVEPPADTRAWGRAMLLRRLGAEAVVDVDWDGIEVRRPGSWLPRRIGLPDPLGAGAAELAGLLAIGGSTEELIAALADPEPQRNGRPLGGGQLALPVADPPHPFTRGG